MIRITFHGAAGTVTGSAYLLDTGRARVLVDFGLFQGVPDRQELNVLPPTLDVRGLDAVLVTHAHLDHTGRLPLLAKHGYQGPIYCTAPTIELSGLILRDSARLQAQDLERTSRKRLRADEPPLEPLYAAPDVEDVLRRMRAVEYDAPVAVAPGVHARFVEAGHLLGSASIQVRIEAEGGVRCVAFSGDLGPRGAPILKDAAGFATADVVVLESTYGDRDHKPFAETVAEFERLVQETVERRGKLLVPTFAVGRAQLLLYLLALMFRRRVVPPFPIYVDSPMAVEASRIYFEHLELFDDDFQALQRERPLLEDLATVRPTPTAEDSKALNDVPGPCLILAGSGMCTGGRILHHFKQNLWRPETRVLIVGYQSEGTLGRALVEGATHVHLFGEKIAVKARIHTLGGFSAHAGQSELLRWCEHLAPCRPEVILTHGEAKGRTPLAKRIQERFNLNVRQPELGDVIEV
jgi:metallo-beta-lactamase family protein